MPFSHGLQANLHSIHFPGISQTSHARRARYMNDGILSTIGNTPLVRLRRIIRDLPFELYGKLEAFNPGGSTKDRPALNIITHGVESGEIYERRHFIDNRQYTAGSAQTNHQRPPL